MVNYNTMQQVVSTCAEFCLRWKIANSSQSVGFLFAVLHQIDLMFAFFFTFVMPPPPFGAANLCFHYEVASYRQKSVNAPITLSARGAIV